jgi:hypothetical protein
MNSKTKLLYGILVLIALLLPFQDFIYLVFAMKVLCFALFACAFNLLLGFTGLLSFGHAAFFGTSAYITAYLCKEAGLSPEFGIVLGVLGSGILGFLIGSLAIRRQGIYFAMVTLALSQMVYFLAVQLPFTGGEDGIQGVPRGMLFGLIDLKDDISMYYFVLAIFLLGFALIVRTVHSPFGQVLKADLFCNFSSACWPCWIFEDIGFPVGDIDRCSLAYVWRSRVNDFAWRHGNYSWPCCWCWHCGWFAKLSSQHWILEHYCNWIYFRNLRVGIPSRCCW